MILGDPAKQSVLILFFKEAFAFFGSLSAYYAMLRWWRHWILCALVIMFMSDAFISAVVLLHLTKVKTHCITLQMGSSQIETGIVDSYPSYHQHIYINT